MEEKEEEKIEFPVKQLSPLKTNKKYIKNIQKKEIKGWNFID